jgi:LysM repeat protein
MDARRTAARFAAPAAFLAAATIAVLLVRSALSDEQTTPVQPRATTTAATTTESTTTQRTQTTTTTAEGSFYEIEPGDTLETIAADHGTTVEQLLVLNPEIDPVALSIGQRIRVG